MSERRSFRDNESPYGSQRVRAESFSKSKIRSVSPIFSSPTHSSAHTWRRSETPPQTSTPIGGQKGRRVSFRDIESDSEYTNPEEGTASGHASDRQSRF